MQPALALGIAVHEVVESLSFLPVEKRFENPLDVLFEKSWGKVAGEKGGFGDAQEEALYKKRGKEMIRRLQDNPGLLKRKAVKIRQDLPYFWLSDEDAIIVCGKIDWLEYIERDDSVRIIDFKTGKFDEDPDSLQLPLYFLLAKNCQYKRISGAAYWYVDRDDEPTEVSLPDEVEAYNRVREVAERVALARKLERFVCTQKDGCSACRPLESIVAGKAKHVGVNDFGQDLYVLMREEPLVRS